jgi:catechol 2,3-dioxygenase-like lactoylglutathione lyase family enzyme
VYGVSHLDVPVRDLARAARFYGEALGFRVRQSGDGFVDVDATTAALRLVETTSGERRAAIRIQVGGVEAVFAGLLAAGARRLYEPQRGPAQELWAAVQDFDGNTLTVWRPLSEDEYGYLPSLPVDGAWAPEAEALLKSLLLAVPALFRGLARRKVVKLAEELRTSGPVTPIDVVRAYILSSARITRYRLKAPLVRHGYDPEAFRAEFEAD